MAQQPKISDIPVGVGDIVSFVSTIKYAVQPLGSSKEEGSDSRYLVLDVGIHNEMYYLKVFNMKTQKQETWRPNIRGLECIRLIAKGTK